MLLYLAVVRNKETHNEDTIPSAQEQEGTYETI